MRAAVLALAALALAGCSGEKQIGDEDVLARVSHAPVTTSTPTPAPTPAAASTARPTPGPRTTPAPQAATAQLAVDQKGFDPPALSVERGTTVVVTNRDADMAHSVVCESAGWNTGPIPAKGTGAFVADKTGSFVCKDGEVPYRTIRIEVT